MGTNKRINLVLTTVNAPYWEQLDGTTLTACLSDVELAKQHPGHVSSFLGEVPITLQVEFALEHGIAPHRLVSLATRFSEWSGEYYPLTKEAGSKQ